VGILSNVVELYKRQTQEIIGRLLEHQLSFPDCIATLDDALAELMLRLKGEQIDHLRDLILKNNEIVMAEMERRGPPVTAIRE
jgi:hypothetical protein